MIVVVGTIINVVFLIEIAVVFVVINCEDPTLSPTFRPGVRIIIVGVDEAKGSIIGIRGVFIRLLVELLSMLFSEL